MKALTKRQAESLLTEIRQNILDLDKNLRDLILGRGWESLGYDTFAAMWEERLSDLRLSQMWTKAVVTQALASDGMSAVEIATLIGGNVRTTSTILAQLMAGVPAERVSHQAKAGPDETVVKEYVRKKERAEPHVIHVKLTPSERKRFESIAKMEGMSLDEAAENALRLYFSEKAADARGAA